MRISKKYLLALLTVILAFNYVDRFALGVLLQDIKVELALSDTQLGLLTGIAFAVFYSVMGIPIARWADRGNRVTIISLTTGLWSIAVAVCGAAVNFTQLLLMRMGVAVGEAGCFPPALSLISDYFNRTERPRAVAYYMLGAPLAMVIGYFAAGWLNEYYGWRMTFLLLGLPGIGLAVLAAWMLKDPRFSKAPAAHSEATLPVPPDSARPASTLREVVRTLWANEAFRHIFFCFSVWGFFGYGIMQWLPVFFIRSHHLATGELGSWLALTYGVGSVLGTWLGGEWAARYAANNERLQFVSMALMYVAAAVLWVGVYLAPDQRWAFAMLAATSIAAGLANGPLFAATQTLVPPRMRAMSISIMYLFCNLIGMGLGPLAVGALSDALQPSLGDESLRYALLTFSPGYLWCAWHLWKASRTVTRDVSAAINHSSEFL